MESENINGILVLDKPKGLTSHDVVNIVRRLLATKKVGHAGTLDPIATGVLVILVGGATRKSDLLSGDDKEYAVRLRLGTATDTADASGKIIKTSDTGKLDERLVRDAILSFKGDIEQIPPMFSAVKFKGETLYKLARKGVTIPRKPRKITIREIVIKNTSIPDAEFNVVCTKGTYIRQLCADIGERLGCGAHMAELRRIRSGKFHISQALSIGRLKTLTGGELVSLLRI